MHAGIYCFRYCPSTCWWGGLIAGVSTYIKETNPEIDVIGVEANGARSMKAAFEAGGPVKLKDIDKFADGIAVQKVGELTYEATRKHVETPYWC